MTSTFAPPPGVSALLFDLGGVLIDIDWRRVFNRWAEHSPLTADEIALRFRMDAPYERHERGELDAAGYFAHLREVLRFTGDDMALIAGWNAIFAGEIAPTIALLERCASHLPCYLLTNTNPTHEHAWRRDFPRAIAPFDAVFVSSTLGHRKPERAAFDAVLAHAGVTPGEMLFFDDSAENVIGARAAGLRTVQVHGPEDIAAALGA
ncbi:MAG: HAD family hydrolase [Gammaproteobacteria bacterium]